jgi:pyruvate kinase
LRVARERAIVPILGMTTSEKTANQMGLIWGVTPVWIKTVKHIGEVAPLAIENAKQYHLAKRGEQMIITAGYPFGGQGNTNILYIVDV